MDQAKLNQLGEVVFKQLGLKEDMSLKFISAALEAIKKFDENHTEKGLEPYAEYGPIGVMIEFDKKRNKLRNHYHPEIGEEYDSASLEEAWEDACVYALMGKLVENGEWCNSQGK